jgi:hypothetical protein
MSTIIINKFLKLTAGYRENMLQETVFLFFLSFSERENRNDVKTIVSAYMIHKIVDLVTLVYCSKFYHYSIRTPDPTTQSEHLMRLTSTLVPHATKTLRGER